MGGLTDACAHIRQVSAAASRRGTPGQQVIRLSAGGHPKGTPVPGWRVALALALNALPAGSSLVITDASGRDWYIAPANQAAARTLRKAA